jgi:outer membrane PBP1 activator LpoA protein
MQIRLAFSSLVCSLLYWALLALATGIATADDSIDKVPGIEPHIAVILPLQSASFGRLADSVRLGVLNAAGNAQPGSLKVRIYGTDEDPQRILAAYQQARSMGARAVIGPLTRNGVTVLAQSGLVSIPTLALNIPDGETQLPRDLYVYGLQIESEARQVAQFAFRSGGSKAFVIAGDSPLGGRIAQAFTEEWKNLKVALSGRFEYTTDSATLARLREQVAASGADIVFMSLDASRARFIRPYLGISVPVYATSMIFTSSADVLANHDLEGVRFLDMPWLLQPDHPAVISYSQPDAPRTGLDQERFYALGIDAYRLAQELLRPYETMEPLDGVTGTITLNNAHQFIRTLVPAQFSQGVAKLLEGSQTR